MNCSKVEQFYDFEESSPPTQPVSRMTLTYRLPNMVVQGTYDTMPVDFSDNVVVPTHEEVLSKLPSDEYDSEKHQDGKCSICQLDYEDKEIITKLPCDHTFHKECIKQWLKNYNHICPVCRHDLNE